MEAVRRRDESSSPTATKLHTELGVKEAFDALSGRVEAGGGVVRCVTISGVVLTGDDPHAFAMGEGFASAEDLFNFQLSNVAAMGDALGIPVHVGLTERIGRDD